MPDAGRFRLPYCGVGKANARTALGLQHHHGQRRALCSHITLDRVMSSGIESLVCALIPDARQDDALREEIVAQCQEVLGR